MKKLIFISVIVLTCFNLKLFSQLPCNDSCYWKRTGNIVSQGQFLGYEIASDINIYTAGVERMRITNAGKVYIAGPVDSIGLHIPMMMKYLQFTAK